jgi:hypothetical protein
MNRRGFFGGLFGAAVAATVPKTREETACPLRVVEFRPILSAEDRKRVREMARRIAEDCKAGRCITLPAPKE